MSAHRTALVASAFALCAGACNNPAFYDGAQRLVVRAADIEAASAEDSTTGNPTIGAYKQSEYWLDFREPSAADLADLQPPGSMPSEQTPWIRRDDVTASISWTLTNDSDAPLTAWVLLDGATEFFDYDPISTYGAAGGAEEDEIQYPSLAGFTPRQLGPGEVLRGEFREDDLREAMYDLDSVTRFCAGPLAVLNHRHEADPIGTDVVPDDAVIAAAVMLRITLGASGPATLEYDVRLRESEDKIFDSARDARRYEVMPEPYALPGAAALGGGTSGGGTGADAQCEGGGSTG
jgi:hypothetical protein